MAIPTSTDAVRREWATRIWTTYFVTISMLVGISVCVYLFLFADPIVQSEAFLRSSDDIVWAEIQMIQRGFMRPERYNVLWLGGEDYCARDDESGYDQAHVMARWRDAGVHLAWHGDSRLTVTFIGDPKLLDVLRTTYMPCPKTHEVWTGETWVRKPISRKPVPVRVEFAIGQIPFR